MRIVVRVLCPALALALLAGCAVAPRQEVVSVPPPGPITVACTEGAISDQPCLADAQRDCPTPEVDTIHLVLAKQDGDRSSYAYRATYNCPVRMTAVVAPQ